MNPSEHKTYFVTLNWNTTSLLQQMVASVEATTPEPHTWIIVDNGSDEENTVRLYDWAHYVFEDLVIVGDAAAREEDWTIEDEHTDVVIVRLEENVGCILGHNLAFGVARGLSQGAPHEIVMLDTDVVVTEQGWLSKVRTWAGPEVGVVGLEHGPNHVCSGAVFLDTNGNWYLHEEQMMREEPAEGESAGLGFALIRWPVLRAGLRFDTGFRLYYKQDDDFCFQVRNELGLEVWAYPVGNVHFGSGSLKANDYQCGEASGFSEFDQIKQDNQKYFTEKWRWALRDRRATMAQEAAHLAEMKRLMAEERGVQ
jgi:GT2 family glycosyltransferase